MQVDEGSGSEDGSVGGGSGTGIKFLSQIDMRVPPAAAENLVRLGDPTVGGGGRRQIDLYLPGAFAAETTPTALAAAGDFALWTLEPASAVAIAARCAAADSGAVPCSVALVVNGVPVGTPVQAVASAWTVQTQSGVTLQTGDEIEIAVTDAGTNGDSAWLRFTLTAEVQA